MKNASKRDIESGTLTRRRDGKPQKYTMKSGRKKALALTPGSTPDERLHFDVQLLALGPGVQFFLHLRGAIQGFLRRPGFPPWDWSLGCRAVACG